MQVILEGRGTGNHLLQPSQITPDYYFDFAIFAKYYTFIEPDFGFPANGYMGVVKTNFDSLLSGSNFVSGIKNQRP
jgi:hypothetical protein